MQLKRPLQRFIFQEAGALKKKAKHHLRFYPVFADASPADIAQELGLDNIETILKKHSAMASFKALPGQILHLVEQDIILGGLGKRQTWHPEKACELFRGLGSKLAAFKELSLEFRVTDSLIRAIQEHLALKDGFHSFLKLDLKKKPQPRDAQKKKAPKSQDMDGGESEEEAEAPLDYIGEVSLADLLTQFVVCVNIGAESMELLKSKASVPKQSIPVSIAGPGMSDIKADELTRLLDQNRNVSEMLQGARYLASLPGNYINPEGYERYARGLAQEFKLKIEVFGQAALEELGCGGILAVGQGSAVPPRMIVLSYQPNKTKVGRPLVLVGKGITFDTGGISIKPSAEMHEMKYDMCGSALALHTIALAAAQKLPLPVVALLGVAENMPDGKAIKPGDVYKAYDGSSVEIQNTDAEGRLVLGDLLAYAVKNYDPLCLLDFATLTGACVIALGHDAAGVMTASEDLFGRIHKASVRSLDRAWRLPHWFVYGRGLKSDVADQRNVAGRAGGTLSAMRFLARFVPPEIPWAHFDIAGTAWRDKPFGSQGKGATAWGIRLLHAFMEDLVR